MPVGGTIRISPLGIALLVGCGLLLAYLNLPGVHVGSGGGGGSSRGGKENLISMKRLLAVAIEVAKRVGREVKEVRESVRFLACLPRAFLVMDLFFQIDLGERSKGKTQEGANNPGKRGNS